jgi:hypothetical protein
MRDWRLASRDWKPGAEAAAGSRAAFILALPDHPSPQPDSPQHLNTYASLYLDHLD